MPGVGKKKFSYNPMGRLSASKEARKTGMPVRTNRSRPMSPLRPMGNSMGRPMGRPMGKPMRKPVENRGGARKMGTPSMSRVMSGRKKY